jgi:hypothetical protein
MIEIVWQTVAIDLYFLYVFAFLLMIFMKTGRSRIIIVMTILSFLLTPVNVVNHDWAMASLSGLTAILMSIYIATDEISKKLNKP